MAFFPMFFDLEGKDVCVAGAGTVGSRRIEALLRFGACVTVVSKEASGAVQRLCREKKLKWIASDYRDYKMEQSFFMVLAATGDEEADELAAKDGRAVGAFVNVAGDRTKSDFYFPGIAKEGAVTAGIIADGTNHKLAKDVTGQVQKLLTESLAKREADRERQGTDEVGQ